MKLISVIVPCYNEEENITDFYDELMKTEAYFKKEEVDFEILYVSDGSRDNTVQRVKELHQKDERVHLINF